MNDVFRFVSIRPAQSVDKAKTVSISGNTPFQEKARKAVTPGTPLEGCWKIVRQAAEEFVRSTPIFNDVTSLALFKQFNTFRSRLEMSDKPSDLKNIGGFIQDVFGQAASSLEADKKYLDDRARIWDSIVLIFVLPTLHRAPFNALVKFAQVIDIIRRVATEDATLDCPTIVQAALLATITLPTDLFPSVPGRLRPVGVADLLVVKHHIQRFELGEIVQIEDTLCGESRKETNKHIFPNEPTKTTETTNERFSLKREAKHIIKEDTNVKVGVSVTYKYGPTVQTNANANIDYANSKVDSQKISSDYAKDVTSRAASKVAQQIHQQETTRIIETFEEDAFGNTKGTTHISGVCQWVNKIYKAQVFNYGKRLLFDITVPEPAALVLDAATIQSQTQQPQGQPADFTLTPAELGVHAVNKNYYGKYIIQYGVEGVSSPPLDNITVAKTFTLSRGDKAINKGAELAIPDGYRAISVHVDGQYNYTEQNNNGLNLWVGDKSFQWLEQTLRTGADAKFNTYSARYIPVVIEAWNVGDYGILVQILCEPLNANWETWRLDTHRKILSAWQKKQKDFQDALPDNPVDNRRIERTELKRSAIALLCGNDLLDFNAIDHGTIDQPLPAKSPIPKRFPHPHPEVAQENFARFIERAFEWEQMTYDLYPYFWARREIWQDKVMRTNADPLFTEFLCAGQARVVVPVRPSLEPAVYYFLMTGQVWEGGDAPSITDSDYLPIAEEIKEASSNEVPYGPSWDIVVPTTLIKPGQNDQINNVTWTLTPPWTWIPSPSNSEVHQIGRIVERTEP